MHKKIVTILLLSALALFCNVEAQERVTPSAQYKQESETTPYKTTHKAEKQRRVNTRQGNHALKKKGYSDAVTKYRTALKSDSSYAKAQYNAAIAHGKLHQNDTALYYYSKVCGNSSATRSQRANAHYNAGNIHLRKALATRDTGGYDSQSLHAAIEEYKSSLRLEPKNSDAQHNLSLAKQLLRPEQGSGGGGGGNQNQDQNQQQNQQNQDKQNQDKQNQDQQQNQQNQNHNQNQNDNQKQDQQQQKKQGQQQSQNRREAEQMLNAMKNNEQQTMKAVRMKEAQKERRQGIPVRIEKDW
jgi:hypothetical protein